MKKLILILCLLLLVSCGGQTEVDIQDLPDVDGNGRTHEEQLLDKHLTMLLREQLAGAYDVEDASFIYMNSEELDGKECFVYEMKKGSTAETFAVSTDSTAIYHMDGKDFVKIFDGE